MESNSLCAVCGREAVGGKSLCCSANVITPTEYERRKQRAGIGSTREVQLTSTATEVGYTVTFTQGAAEGVLRSFGRAQDGTVITDHPVKLPAPQKFVDDMVATGWAAEETAASAIGRTLEGNEAVAKFNRTGEQPATPLQASLSDTTGNYVAAPSNLKTAEVALKFVLAGNAYFTVRSLKTGVRYTYRVNRADCSRCGKKDCHCWNFPTYFVALLTGPDNTGDYTYLGMIRENLFRLTRGSKMQESSVPVKAFRWVYEHLVKRTLPPQTEIWHEGRCGVCGRPLTVPESIESGIGPVCAGKE